MSKTNLDKPKKGMTLEECVSNADKFISKNGKCLLLFDVVGSKKYTDKNKLIYDLTDMIDNLNRNFSKYLPENNLGVLSRYEKGFNCLLGDASWAGINSSEVIPKIIDYVSKNYSHIKFYWGVAKDGYDDDNVKIAK